MKEREIFIGYDKKERIAFDVCKYSLKKRSSVSLDIKPLKINELIQKELYTRPHENREGIIYDVISEAPMSTEFANSRWLVPFLSNHKWSLFMDCDMLVMSDIDKVFQMTDDKYAVMCVKHKYAPEEKTKMDGQIQTSYSRKNWSSFVLFNNHHPANLSLTNRIINRIPGKYLHAFFWLDDNEIGELPEGWNWLEGHSSPDIIISNIHYTRGGPWFEECKDVGYADLWLRERDAMLGVNNSHKIVNPV
jgi:hypothetical protein